MAESRIISNLLRRTAADSGEVLVILVLGRTEDSAFLDTNAWNMLLLLLTVAWLMLVLVLVRCVYDFMMVVDIGFESGRFAQTFEKYVGSKIYNYDCYVPSSKTTLHCLVKFRNA
jgi:hypothetical protein